MKGRKFGSGAHDDDDDDEAEVVVVAVVVVVGNQDYLKLLCWKMQMIDDCANRTCLLCSRFIKSLALKFS